MKLTAVVQQGEDGHVLVARTTVATVQRELRAWQGGSHEILRLRELYHGDRSQALDIAWEHHIGGAWFEAPALPALREALSVGREDGLRDGIDAAHSAAEEAARAKIPDEVDAAKRATILTRMRGGS